MEKRTRVAKPLYLSEPTRCEQANPKCQTGVAIYSLRHVFCTPLSWVAPDAIVQRAMRHSSPDIKRRYQLGLIHQVREHLERANEKTYQGRDPLHFRDSRVPMEVPQIVEVRN
jgi:hypothetical protein